MADHKVNHAEEDIDDANDADDDPGVAAYYGDLIEQLGIS